MHMFVLILKTDGSLRFKKRIFFLILKTDETKRSKKRKFCVWIGRLGTGLCQKMLGIKKLSAYTCVLSSYFERQNVFQQKLVMSTEKLLCQFCAKRLGFCGKNFGK